MALTLAFLLIVAETASAVSPSLTAIRPLGFKRGGDIEATFSGARLGDVEELLLYSPGVTVKSLAAEDDKKFKATLAIAPECRLGIHAVRVRTKGGVSNLRLFTIGALDEVAEVEPNSEFSSPQRIEVNTTVSGIVQNEDVEYFVVTLKEGERLTAELEGLRLGNSFFDPYVAILNSERFELARSDDHALLRQDSLCSIIAPKAGDYIIQVRESAYGGDGNSHYRLHVGSFPRPTSVYPAGGKPGEEIELTWIGDAGGDFKTKVKLPDTEGDHGLLPSDDGGVAPSPNMVRVVNLDNVLEVEPNNNRNEATPATIPAAFNGIIGEANDIDYFKFTAKKGQKFEVRVYGRNPLRSPIDPFLYVQRSTGANVGSNDDTGGPDSFVSFTAPADDEYRIAIRDQLKSGGPNYVYRIEVTPLAPKLTLSLPEKTRYISTTIAVPQGNRVATLVNASRRNFGGDIQLEFPGLAAGLSAEAPVMAANRTSVPVIFSATGDAKTGGGLIEATAKPTDEAQSVRGEFSQRTMLIRGQNNRDVLGHDAKRMSVVTMEKIPFSIEIVQPKVPITRNGSYGLKVVAKRDEGFDGAIRVRMLYNPPGIGSSTSVSIAKGENEAIIPLTANSSAAIQSWPIVVTGIAPVKGANVEVSTQMAQLEIVDRYFDFAFDKAAGELGQETDLVVNVTKKGDWEGNASVKLLGVPANTSVVSEPVSINKDSTQMVFKIKIDEKAKPNKYASLVCRATIERDGETITTTLGTGELRVDKPLPPKVAVAPKPAAAPKPKPTTPAAKPVKRLSRLEQLRLDRKKAAEQ